MSMKNPVYPGAVIRDDFLKELGISVSDASRKLGVSRVTLSRVLNGQAALTPNLAVRLELAGIGNARLWLDMQQRNPYCRAARRPLAFRRLTC